MNEKATSTPRHGCMLAVVGFQILLILVALAIPALEYMQEINHRAIPAGADLHKRNFMEANLRRADLSGANLSQANLGQADLFRANLSGANLSGANLSDADLRKAVLYRANLSGANLSDANLEGARLTEANLISANLTSANLSDANLMWAHLNEADLTDADLTDAYLTRANLRGADLNRADLSRADLSQANLSDVDLTSANLTDTILEETNLRGAIVADEQLAKANLLDGAMMSDDTAGSITATAPVVARAAQTDNMVYVPAGEFLMGSPDDDPEALTEEERRRRLLYEGSLRANQKPQHTVYLDAFWIDRVEVTNAAYAQCVEAEACRGLHPRDSWSRAIYYGNPEYDNYPVVNVSWADAQAYCQWAGGRLPTEAEWEKAARGTDGRTYPWGNETPDNNRLHDWGRDNKDTTAVGVYPSGASPYGVLDMLGNVSEWVADWYDDTYYASSPTHNPPGPASGQQRVIRGSSWMDGWGEQTAHRDSREPDFSYYFLGFRCARSE